MEDNRRPPIHTYLFKEESVARSKWYLEKKRQILNRKVREFNPGHEERESFYYSNPRVISDLFGKVLDNNEYSGIRIYFGSCRTVVPEGCDRGDRGKIVLIYVPTLGKDESADRYLDSEEYYILGARKCSRETLTSFAFKELVLNYSEDKRDKLRGTLTAADRANPNNDKETMSLFADREIIEELKTEIDYQLKMSDQYGVTGIKVYINSYTNKPIERKQRKLAQRLTIHFVFTDYAGQDLDLLGIDPEYGKIPKEKAEGLLAFNTMNPTPPFP